EARAADNIYRTPLDNRLFEAKRTGIELWKKIISQHPEMLQLYSQADTNSSLLYFLFESDRELLRLPLELLHNETEFVVIKHPLARVINNVEMKAEPLSRLKMFKNM